MFECDEDFADRIIKLNLLGISTEFCCSGHKETIYAIKNGKLNEIEGYSYPYIIINISKTDLNVVNIILSEALQKNHNLKVKSTDPFLRIASALPEYMTTNNIMPCKADRVQMKNTLFKFVDYIIKYFDKEKE